VSDGRRLYDAVGVRGLPGAPFGARLTAGAGYGDGQPLLSQKFSRAPAGRGARLRSNVVARPTYRISPDRGSLLEGQGTAAQLRSAYPRSPGLGDGRSTERDHSLGRLRLLRAPRLPHTGSTAMIDALDQKIFVPSPKVLPALPEPPFRR
jgi:hypothetical protein